MSIINKTMGGGSDLTLTVTEELNETTELEAIITKMRESGEGSLTVKEKEILTQRL